MDNRKPQSRSVADGHGNSFANGPDTTSLPMEGWVIGDIHWWWFA